MLLISGRLFSEISINPWRVNGIPESPSSIVIATFKFFELAFITLV